MEFSDKDKFVEMDKIGATWLDRGAEAYRQGDYELALQCYKKAADYGNSQAMCNLGYIYAFGRVGEADQRHLWPATRMPSINWGMPSVSAIL